MNFTLCIYNYTHEANNIPKLYTVAAILLLQYMAHIMLFPSINILDTIPVLSAESVQCPGWLFPVVR